MTSKKPTHFLSTINHSFSFLEKHFLPYIQLTFYLFLPVLGLGLIPVLVDPSYFLEVLSGSEVISESIFTEKFSLSGFMVPGYFIFIVLTLLFFYEIYGILCLTRLTTSLYHNKYHSIQEILSWSLNRFLGYMMLLIRTIAYTYLWLFVLSLLAFIIVSIIASSFYFNSNVLIITNFILGALALVSLVIMIIRSPRTVMAYYIYAEKKCNSKEALNQSIDLSKKNWGAIVGYIVGFALITMAISFLPSLIHEIYQSVTTSILYFLVQLALTLFNIIFFMMLYKRFDRD